MQKTSDSEARKLFELYMKVVGVPELAPRAEGDPRLRGKKLGIVNGGSWISLWAAFFGRRILPEVHLVNVGNEGVQLNFMKAHHDGLPVPPQINIDLFERYARDLVELVGVDAVLISCSSMNRAYGQVAEALRPYGVPVVSIDMPMMERAVERGGRTLLVATHGPTVENTRRLLEETGARMGRKVAHAGATVEDAFHRLGEGDIEGHNEVIARAIRESTAKQEINTVVLAQLSMTIFKLSYPDCEKAFGVPVLTSGEEGFGRMREILLSR
ncbi:MAG TPA: aspartate/glutamate racemase family protein [Symbiobacteriaceae bacterium]|nr:aspartate/glutamate racemase family protein [Symbiobacteriaceae bacterium]